MKPASPRRALVTGGAGFIGSHLVEALLAEGTTVTVLDDLSAGKMEFLAAVKDRITFVKGDCSDRAVLDKVLPGHTELWHLAANPEVRTGATDPGAHYDRNVRVTWEVLEGCRRHGVASVAFTSTSTVYGEASVRPTPEHYGPLLPISVYGGAKLACEGLVSAHAATFGMAALMFRFANVVGPRGTHGVVVDFVRKLKADPAKLEVLGDGQQTKSYVSVSDTIAGMLHAARCGVWQPGKAVPLNIGSVDAISVDELAVVVAGVVGAKPKLVHTGGTAGGAGWVGDVKRMGLDVSKLQGLGWKPKDGSAEAVRTAASWLAFST